jgi:hypothetical protein
MDYQYYFGDKDRIDLSRLTDFEREDILMARIEKVKLQSDKIGMSVERMRESAGQEEKKRNSEIEEKKKSEKEEKKKSEKEKKKDKKSKTSK